MLNAELDKIKGNIGWVLLVEIQRKIIVVKYNGKEIKFYVTLGICQIKLNFLYTTYYMYIYLDLVYYIDRIYDKPS